jgi:hypothetical protein
MLRKVFTKQADAKNEKIFFFLRKFFFFIFEYEHRKGLYQVDFLTKTQAGSH